MQIWNLRVLNNQNIEKMPFTVVQIKFLEMHITKQKIYIYSWKCTNCEKGT